METRLYKPAQTRTTETIHHRFKLAVERLALSQRARFLGGPVTMEAVNAALWLWFARLGDEAAEGLLEALLPEVEALLASDLETFHRPRAGHRIVAPEKPTSATGKRRRKP